MLTMRPLGCAFYLLTLAASLCQAAYTPSTPASSDPGAGNGSLTTRDNGRTPDPLAVLFGTAGALHSRGEGDYNGTAGVEARDVYSPRISDPRSSTTWVAGSSAVVRW